MRQKGILTDIKLCTPLPEMCVKGEPAFASNFIIAINDYIRKHKMSREALLLDLMASSGCRISEALDVRGSDILGTHTVHLRGRKRSSDRIVDCVYGLDWGRFRFLGDTKVFGNLDRFDAYRFFKRIGVYEVMPNRKKASICHAARHEKIRSLRRAGASVKDIQTYIGHKSVKSTMMYLDEQEKS